MYLIFNKPSGSLYIICGVIPNEDLKDTEKYKIVEKNDSDIIRGHIYSYDFDLDEIIDNGEFLPDPVEVKRMEDEHTLNEYKRSRASEYPSIQDQLDMQYWDSINGTTVWADMIAAIKAKYPKTITE